MSFARNNVIFLHQLACFAFALMHTPLSCIGGAGGKGTWGKLVEVYDDDGHTHDQGDPNYDSEEEVVRHSTHTHTHYSAESSPFY